MKVSGEADAVKAITIVAKYRAWGHEYVITSLLEKYVNASIMRIFAHHDLAFTYSQLSKFVQSPGPVHLAAAERALAYLRGTYNEGITYCDPGEDRRNKLTGWVDSDFAADPDTRKSMTGYLFSLNGGAVSWRSSRQGGVTLISAEA